MSATRLITVALSVCAFALTAAVAFAQHVSLVSVSLPNGGRVIAQTEVRGAAAGLVVVSFHGDPRAGCSAIGVCTYGGTLIWRPGVAVDLQIEKLRTHGRISYQGFLSFVGGSDDQTMTARVERRVGGRVAGRCVDARQQSLYAPPTVFAPRQTFTFALFEQGGSVLASRCAGPRESDLAAAGPKLTLPIGQLIRGERLIDLGGIRSFAGDGFAGTITSTVRLRLGGARKLGSGQTKFPPGMRLVRMRLVTERLSLIRARGAVTASIRGTSNPDVCALLDACGAAGTVTLHPAPRSPHAELFAAGPAKLPYRDFLVALGLRRGSVAGSIHVAGSVYWDERGTASERLASPERCSDAAPLSDGYTAIQMLRTRVIFSYGPSAPLETSCPGPLLLGPSTPLLSGTAWRGIIMARTFTLTLHDGSSLQDDGYTGFVRGRLALTLRRGGVSQQTITQPQ